MTAPEQKRKWRIAKRLKLTRANAKSKLSQAELARRVQAKGIADFTTSLASRLELGYADATWSEVEALADALGVQPEWLAEIEVAPPPVQLGIAKSQALLPLQPLPAYITTPLPVITAVAEESVPLTPTSAVSPAQIEPPPPIPVPPQGTLSIYEYRTLLGVERKKADDAMAQKGLKPLEWRRWREYSTALTELFRTLQI